jgi:15-cis-phytoene synthase
VIRRAGEPLPLADVQAPHADALAAVRGPLERLAAAAREEGMPHLTLDGQLIRPLVAYGAACGPRRDLPPAGFWEAVLAVQMAHEASLLHDDVIDGAATRRGVPSVAAARGTAAALVLGDHLLTSAYRMAARTGSLAFADRFATAVERTVAGEVEQARTPPDRARLRWRQTAAAKAGALIGCAAAAGAVLRGDPRAEELEALGRRVGVLYQMLDDLLDYCPGAGTGKPALTDYARGQWTWVLEEVPALPFGRPEAEVLQVLHWPWNGEATPLRRCLERFLTESREVRAEAARLLPGDEVLGGIAARWAARAETAVLAEERRVGAVTPAEASASVARVLRVRAPSPETALAVLAAGSRTFRFAARFFPAEVGARVARVYAYCRTTDDLADHEPGPGDPPPAALVDAWLERSRRAYGGRASGVALLDVVMREAARAGLPFGYAEALAEGMRMDLRGHPYATMTDLRVYAHRVAGVVGQWLTELFGVRDVGVLAQAARMGTAMQITNIVRDVGEDLARGRVYLPAELMRTHGVTVDDLHAYAAGAPVDARYRALMEALMAEAEADYRAAFPALAALPRAVRLPVAVAARTYAGIHDALRAAGYDNFRHRAHTTAAAKARLALAAALDLRRVSRVASAARQRAGDGAAAGPVAATGR